LGSDLPCLSECLLDLSVFERVQPLDIGDEHLSELYRRLSDGLEIVVKLDRRLDIEKREDCWTQIEIENEIEKLMNLRHPCVVAPLGFVVSSNWTELKIARMYGRCGSLEEVLQTSPSWWTATAKSIAVVSIALGLRFVQTVGLVCGNLKPSNILFDESHQIQIVDIYPSRAESHRRAVHHRSAERVREVPSKFVAPEVLSGEPLTEKADVFSFASILLSIVMNSPVGQTDERTIAGHSIPESVPQFVYNLIISGMSTNPQERPTIDKIIAKLAMNDFRIAEEVDSDRVWTFVNSVQSSEL
jgi:serine/threonine protein kinase